MKRCPCGMRAMILRKPAPIESSPLELIDLPVPHPGPGEVRIRINACGVCHTDLHTVEGELNLPVLPIIPGHQVVGEIDLVGEASVEGRGTPNPCGQPDGHIAKGTRVGVPWLHSSCGKCRFCLGEQENLCEEIRFTGLNVNGGYEEYMVAPVDFVVPIPPSFSDMEAAPLLCAGIIGYRSLRLSDLKPGETLALFGFGASAHLSIQVARYWGCDVFVFTRSSHHQRLALDLGASWAGGLDDEAPRPADRAITFAPVGSVIPKALRSIRKGGTVAINAIHLDRVPEFPYELIYWERTVKSVTNSTRRDACEFLDVASKIPIKVKTEMYELEEANVALRNLKEGKVQGAAVLRIR